MSTERILPQIVMRRSSLRDLPRIELPAGYSVRSFIEGDEQFWNRIVRAAFDSPTSDFNVRLRADEEFRPERVLFVTYRDEPVATASAWYMKQYGPAMGYLHLVGVAPEHQGKHLGYWVSIAALHQFVVEKRTSAMLLTDDYRLSAIRTYLHAGFDPVLVHENQRERWRAILTAVGRTDLLPQLEPILSGPVVTVP